MKIKMTVIAVILLLATTTLLGTVAHQTSLAQTSLVVAAQKLGSWCADELIKLSIELIKTPSCQTQEAFAQHCVSQAIEGFKMEISARQALKTVANLSQAQAQKMKNNLKKIEQFMQTEVYAKMPVTRFAVSTDGQKNSSHAFFMLGKNCAQLLVAVEAYVLKNPKEDSDVLDQKLIDSCAYAFESHCNRVDFSVLAQKEGLSKEQVVQLQKLVSVVHELKSMLHE